MRLLIVEDDDKTAGYLLHAFPESGHVVDRIADGATGLAVALEGIYDVVTVDRRLPGLDGVSLVRHLREQGVSTPILMLSAVATPAEPGRASGRAATTTSPSPMPSSDWSHRAVRLPGAVEVKLKERPAARQVKTIERGVALPEGADCLDAGEPVVARRLGSGTLVAPAEDWGFWIDEREGMIGWPEFQTKDGKVYPRAWRRR